jgi:hypothetical protein
VRSRTTRQSAGDPCPMFSELDRLRISAKLESRLCELAATELYTRCKRLLREAQNIAREEKR